MVKRFQATKVDRALIEKALARLDAKRVRERKAVTAKAAALNRRRRKERREIQAAKVDYGMKGLPNELRQKLAIAGWKVLCARMEPGAWYLFRELLALMPEYPEGSLKAWAMQKLPRMGLLERAGNPDFKPYPAHAAQGTGRYLYRLHATAEKAAQEWRCELGEGEDT